MRYEVHSGAFRADVEAEDPDSAALEAFMTNNIPEVIRAITGVRELDENGKHRRGRTWYSWTKHIMDRLGVETELDGWRKHDLRITGGNVRRTAKCRKSK